jgi:hypothetical protein
MPKKIDKLTPEQIAEFPKYVEKWTAIGLSTERADFDTAEKAVRELYKISGLQQPKVILRMGSPYSASLGGYLAVHLLNEIFNKKNKVESQVWSQVGSQVESQVRSQVESQDSGFGNYRSGQFWASWFAFIAFLRDLCFWENKILERHKHDEALGLSCGWVWWHEDVCVISNRPTKINRDEQGRLHSDKECSIQYPDGWGLWTWHGVNVEKYVIESPEKITVDDIEKETNAEVRRVKITRYGQDRYLLDSHAEKIHQDEFGVLYRKEIKDDEPLVMVKVVNSTPEPDGSFKDYFLRVDPELRPLYENNRRGEPQKMTARNAVASTFGKRGSEYSLTAQS